MGPYLSERQWGTVREDYSENGDAWDYFTHDHARSRACHWGEDGIAGLSDDKQRLCFSLALWNGKDPILKERLFGLTNSEANHGEDVKEYYFYLDSTPTHSYMKYLYKYPQSEYPYAGLIDTNIHRSRNEPEYELLDTGIFNEDRYFDIFVEYVKASPTDILTVILSGLVRREPAAFRQEPNGALQPVGRGDRRITKAGPGGQGPSTLIHDHLEPQQCLAAAPRVGEAPTDTPVSPALILGAAPWPSLSQCGRNRAAVSSPILTPIALPTSVELR